MQEILSSKITRIAAVMAGVIGLASLVGCGNSGGTSGSGGTTPTVNATAITIDNAGVIPVFGNSSTSTVVYVHNNTANTISGISYSAVVNSTKANLSLKSKLANLFKSNKNLSSVNGSQCSSIAAGQSCPLSIVTPVLSGSSTQGSMDVKASYNVNNKAVSFNQIINYAQVQNNLVTAGAKFKAGIDISGYGNPTGYATIYLYGSGQNQVYNVSSMTINKPAVTIVNGNISGHQIQSNFVQAVEVSSPILTSSISATITVNSSTLQANSAHVNNSAKSTNKNLKASKSLLTSDQFSNSVDLAVEPVAAGAILTTGLIPLLNTVSTTSGSLLVQNSGNQNAVLGSASADAGISNLSGCSGETRAPAASCTISFNVTESGGSGNITIPYTGGSTSSIAANVTWFNGVGAALVSMSASNNPLTFSATVGGSTTITVQNIGGYTLRNISVPAPVVVGGSATATLANNNCAESVTLPIGSSCSYDVEVADSATDLNQQINLGFSASYAGPNGTQAYSRVMPLAYSSTAYGAIIAISPTNPSLTISGNNFESSTQVLTISNSGNLPANISSVLSDNPAYLTESATTCGATLAAEASCTSTIQFGPTYSAAGASGASNYTVDYTAVGQTPSGSVVSSIDWTVQSYAQSISLTNHSALGATSGNGESAETQYNFTALGRDQVITKSITLTYTNTGTNPMKITGIQDGNSPYTWQVGGDGTTCISGTTLAPADTCKIVYDSVFESNILALRNVGTTYTENLAVPTLIYQDADNSNIQFSAQPNLPTGGVTVYAQSNQATLANSVAVNQAGTAYESVTVSHLLANADDALNVTVITQMEDYFVTLPGVGMSDGCTLSSENGVLTQRCIMGKDNLSMSATYMVNHTLFDASTDLILTTLFSTDQLSQIVSMNPIFTTANLGSFSGYAYLTAINSSYTKCGITSFGGQLVACGVFTPVAPGVLTGAWGITINNGFAYITNAAESSYTQCSVDSHSADGLLTNCNTVVPSSPGELNIPTGITINNGFAYIVNLLSSSYTKCEVAPLTGVLSACVTTSLYENMSIYPMRIAFAGDFAFITLFVNNAYLNCAVDPSNGTLGNCSGDVPVAPGELSYPAGITSYNDIVYITNAQSNSYTQCKIGVSGVLDCNTLVPSGATLAAPAGIKINNGIAYIVNQAESSYTQCNVAMPSGDLNSCATYMLPAIIDKPGYLGIDFANNLPS